MTGSTEQSRRGPSLPETRRRKETKDRLLSAALDVFAETGVAAASIEQISEAAGFTRGAFYSNFSSKEDLLLTLMAQEQDSVLWQAEVALGAAIGEKQPSTMDELVPIVLETLQELARCGNTWLLIRRELQLAALRDREVAAMYEASEERMYAQIVTLLDTTIARMDRKTIVPSADLARLIVAALDLSEQERLLRGQGADLESSLFARTVLAMLTHLTEPIG